MLENISARRDMATIPKAGGGSNNRESREGGQYSQTPLLL